MMADSQPLSGAPEGAEYLRAVLRAPVYEAAQVTPLQKMEKLSSPVKKRSISLTATTKAAC